MYSNVQASKKRVLVIGAGPCGLTTIKQCVDEGLEVVCVEQFESLGGLWRYRPKGPSVAMSTIMNTSKEFSAFSDFPPPASFPNYMHNKQFLRYFEMYAEQFKLEQYIRYETKVVNLEFNEDHEDTGRWKVTFESVQGSNDASNGSEQFSEVFDGVAIATGHHVTPNVPQFPGQELFKGTTMHTHEYKTSEQFKNKVVLVVGVGNSGLDAAVEVSSVASELFLSTRRGTWVRSRLGSDGRPLDWRMATLVNDLMSKVLPSNFVNNQMEKMCDSKFDHELFGLKPKHRFLEQHPTINDALPHCVVAGAIKVRGNIERFTETGIIFEGSKDGSKGSNGSEIKIDAVIFGTGYKLKIPFVDSSIFSIVDSEFELFKQMFRFDLKHAHTLGLIGSVQPLGPVHTTAEMQARWFAALMSRRVKLPSKLNMKKGILEIKKYRENGFYRSLRHSLEIPYMSYIWELGTYIGCTPNLVSTAIWDPKLCYKLIFGTFSTYQFRLNGKYNWSGAREAIMSLDARVDEPFRT